MSSLCPGVDLVLISCVGTRFGHSTALIGITFIFLIFVTTRESGFTVTFSQPPMMPLPIGICRLDQLRPFRAPCRAARAAARGHRHSVGSCKGEDDGEHSGLDFERHAPVNRRPVLRRGTLVRPAPGRRRARQQHLATISRGQNRVAVEIPAPTTEADPAASATDDTDPVSESAAPTDSIDSAIDPEARPVPLIDARPISSAPVSSRLPASSARDQKDRSADGTLAPVVTPAQARQRKQPQLQQPLTSSAKPAAHRFRCSAESIAGNVSGSFIRTARHQNDSAAASAAICRFKSCQTGRLSATACGNRECGVASPVRAARGQLGPDSSPRLRAAGD